MDNFQSSQLARMIHIVKIQNKTPKQEPSPLEKLDKLNLAEYLKQKTDKSKPHQIKKFKPSATTKHLSNIGTYSITDTHDIDVCTDRPARGIAWQGKMMMSRPEYVKVNRPAKDSMLSRLAAKYSKNSSFNRSSSEIDHLYESKVLPKRDFSKNKGDDWKSFVSWKSYSKTDTSKDRDRGAVNGSKGIKAPVRKPVLTGEICYKQVENTKKAPQSRQVKSQKKMKWDLSIKNMPIRVSIVSHKKKSSLSRSQSKIETSSPNSPSRKQLYTPEEITFRPQYSDNKSQANRASYSSVSEWVKKVTEMRNTQKIQIEKDEESSYVLEHQQVGDLSYSPECLSPSKSSIARPPMLSDNQTRRSTLEMGFELNSENLDILNRRHINFEDEGEQLKESSDISQAKTVDKYFGNHLEDQIELQSSEILGGFIGSVGPGKKTYKTSITERSIGECKGPRGSIYTNRAILASKIKGMSEINLKAYIANHNFMEKKQNPCIISSMQSNLNKTNARIQPVRNYSVFEVWNTSSSNLRFPHVQTELLSMKKQPKTATDLSKSIKSALKHPQATKYHPHTYTHILPPHTHTAAATVMPQTTTALYDFDDDDHHSKACLSPVCGSMCVCR